MTDQILIIDFGAPNTQFIARAFRNAHIYCEIIPYNRQDYQINSEVKGVVFTSFSKQFKSKDLSQYFWNKLPEDLPKFFMSASVELCTPNLEFINLEDNLKQSTILALSDFNVNSAFQGMPSGEIKGIDFKPEEILFKFENYPQPAIVQLAPGSYWINILIRTLESEVFNSDLIEVIQQIAKITPSFTPENFIHHTVREIKEEVGDQKVIMAISGGVDSTVAAHLIHKAIGKNLYCFFVDTGLMRKNEGEEVLKNYQNSGLNIKCIQASERYFKALEGKTDPEEKRKIIGGLFIELFQEEAEQVPDAIFLGQGTIYPDIIESIAVDGSPKIKSHHNVGGLPDFLQLKLVEPLKYLFKDEVRKVGHALGIEAHLIDRHPFPGPGLGIRILGGITPEKARILQDADYIYIELLREWNLYHKVWQAAAILLPVQSVGSQDGERTYEYTLAIRAVNSVDGMTAQWVHLPYEFLNELSERIIKEVKGINRVVYDISNKPPATIEWE